MIDKKIDWLLAGESVACVVSPGISCRGHQKQDWWLITTTLCIAI